MRTYWIGSEDINLTEGVSLYSVTLVDMSRRTGLKSKGRGAGGVPGNDGGMMPEVGVS